MKNKLIKCKICETKFECFNSLRPYCSYECGAKYAVKLQENKKAKDWKVKKADMKSNLLTHKDYIKMLQVVFNTYIRERDKDLPCVSCNTFHCEEFHAGHYLASTYQYHRFNPTNVHKQCSRCNTHLRGNLIPYRIELIKRIGLNEVEYLENSRHMMLEITIPELKEKIKEYKQKINEYLKKS